MGSAIVGGFVVLLCLLDSRCRFVSVTSRSLSRASAWQWLSWPCALLFVGGLLHRVFGNVALSMSFVPSSPKNGPKGVPLLSFRRLIVEQASLFPVYVVLLEAGQTVFLVWLPWFGYVKLLGVMGVALSRFGENWCHLFSVLAWRPHWLSTAIVWRKVQRRMFQCCCQNRVAQPHCVHQVCS